MQIFRSNFLQCTRFSRKYPAVKKRPWLYLRTSLGGSLGKLPGRQFGQARHVRKSRPGLKAKLQGGGLFLKFEMDMEKENIQLQSEHKGLEGASQQMRGAAPPPFQLQGEISGQTPGPVASAPMQLSTKIVDDPKDPVNTHNPGTGKGKLQNSVGKVDDWVTFGGLQNDCATSMSAWIFPNNFDSSGTAPKVGTWPSWWAKNAPKDNQYWVRGHLLNHNVGGPGEKRNLTPITKKANSAHHSTVEKVIKLANETGGNSIIYEVTAVYDGKGPKGLKGDAYDPNPACWPLLTTGFNCYYKIQYSESKYKEVTLFIPNAR